jgi:hypothetical protein
MDNGNYHLPVRTQRLEESFLGELQMEGVVTINNENVHQLQ